MTSAGAEARLIATNWVERCNACGSETASEIARSYDYGYETCANEFVFARCADCGLVYLRNRPDVSTLPVIYPPDYGAYNVDEFLGPVITWLRGRVQAMKLKPIRKYARVGATIVDVGCGSAAFLRVAKQFGDPSWRLIGVDFADEAMRDLARHGIEGRRGRFEEMDWSECPPDVIVMNQMIEHFEDPRAILQRAFEILSPGGVIVMETPSLEGWDARVFRGGYWGGWHTPRHWFVFTEGTLRKLAESRGFEVVDVTYLLNPYSWLHSMKYAIANRYRLKRVANLFEVNNLPLLAAASAVDAFQRVVRRRTSNMRLVGRKPKSAPAHAA